jgi:hypothetical protein
MARRYTALLLVAVTKGWPAALHYDQQKADEFVEFRAGSQPQPRAAQPASEARGRTAIR